MFRFNNLRLRNKLRILSIFSILSLAILGFVSNYFFRTSRMIGVIINAERVHNNTFQEGVEDFYKFQISKNELYLDSAILKIESANQMAYNFAIIDQLLQLPKNEYIDILYNNYKVAYNYDRSNAYLMASRLKLFLILKKDRLVQAQQIAKEGYTIGEKIKNKVLELHLGKVEEVDKAMETDLQRIRFFYQQFADVISSLNTFSNELLIIGILLIVIALIIVVMALSVIISRSIAKPVEEMAGKFKVIASGNLNVQIQIDSENEIGQLAQSFRQIQEGLHEVIAYTRKVASGDYDSQIVPRSDQDELSLALNKMVRKLKESHEKDEQVSWFRNGLNLINQKLQGEQSVEEISANSLSFMMDFVHAQLGSIHLFDEDYQFLKLVESSGFDSGKQKERIKLNEGIIGQSAAEKRMILLTDIPDKSYITFSSSGQYIPRQIVVSPMIFNETLVGVLELASLQQFTDIEIQFVKQVSEIIAINLISAINTLTTNELLKKTQDQASELQVQQEELRVANEELVEHTKVLTENEKRLQVQQEELRVANEELEERTRQLEIQKEDITGKNQELTETRDKLEIKARELNQASQYKSEFLANMSHELRTPLNSLLILSNILANNKKGNLTDDQVQSAKIIHKSGTDLLYLINEVLDLSKIEAGKMNLEIDEVKTSEIKEEILMNFNATADSRNLSFDVRVAREFPAELKTDRYRLMQIMRNLLSNAFKFTNTGGIMVDFMPTPPHTTFRSPGLSASNTCCVKVTDTGVGIQPEKLDAIFEAFQQADGSISRKFGGTGLGLSISKELVKMLGGEIQLESQINKGSAFYVFLPVHLTSAPEMPVAEAKPEAADKQSHTTIQEATHELVLEPFIDDDRHEILNGRMVLIIHPVRDEAEKYLAQARAKNYKAIVSPSVNDGIVAAETYHPKAIMLAAELADPANPDYQKLKSHSTISKLPVHVISAVDYNQNTEGHELKSLVTIGFADALNSVETHFISSSKRILVVEDDVITRKVIKTLLSELDVEVESVNFAEEAYQKLTHETFDCIILDLGLPDYSGKELLEKLKTNHIAIPKVIVYTGTEMSKEDLKSLNSFTNTVILKGIKSNERLMDEVTLFLHQVSKTIPEVHAKSAHAIKDHAFKGKRILVVDDEIRNVYALGKILEERDIEVLEAENGQVAIDMLRENSPVDLVLMDVMMPVMDGYEAIRVIRNTPKIKDIPIICLTAKAMKEDHENALKNGANDYLSKPLNEDKLFAMLKIWLFKK